MKKFILLALSGLLGSACTAGVPPDGESIEGLSDAIDSACNTQSGLMPTKASLAVAAAMELKRWDPLTDFVKIRDSADGLDYMSLSPAGNSRCAAMGSSCSNIKGLLGLQYVAVNQVVDQTRFNATTFRRDLQTSLQRQLDRKNELTMNNPAGIPAAHNMTKVGGPTNLGLGGCGPHWVFRVTKPDGSAYPNPGNLVNNLYFYGEPNNPYIAFTVVNGTDVAIDPIDGDNSTPVTVSGSCPTYSLDRVYDPTGAVAGKCCVTLAGLNGAMLAVPKAPGYYGCKAGAVPTR